MGTNMHWYNLVLLLGKPVEAKCTCCAAVTTAHPIACSWAPEPRA
jgi:hypothetical protein